MGLKTNAVIGVVFLALLGFVYFYELKGGKEREEEAQQAKQLLRFSQHEAQGLTLVRGDSTVVLQRSGEDWNLLQPVEAPADQEAVERLLRNLEETERERVLEDSAALAADPSLAAQYKLTRPRLKVVLATAQGVLDTLFFGGDSPTERFTYVQQSGSNRQIFAVRAWRFDNLDKGAFALRDRRVLALEPAAVQRVRLQRADEEILAVRDPDKGWQLREPLAAPAEGAAMDQLLERIKSAEVEAYVAEEPDAEALAGFGLNPWSTVQVSLFLGEEGVEKRLQVGSNAKFGYHYGRDRGRPPVFTVDSTLVQELVQPLAKLRLKKTLQFSRDQITAVELWRQGQLLAARQDTAGVWHLTAPVEQAAKSWKFSGMLTELRDVEVAQFVADGVKDFEPFGLASPQVRVKLLAGEETVLEVGLGNQEGDLVYLRRLDEESVYLVDKVLLNDLELPLEEVVQPLPDEKNQAGKPDSLGGQP